MFVKSRHIFPSAFFISAMGLVLYVAQAATMSDSEQVSSLLQDVKAQASQLSYDASMLEAYTRSGASWEAHAPMANQVGDHINEAGKLLTKLDGMKKSASPWQVTAIERIDPLLRESAANLQAVIKYLNDNPKRLFLPEFRDHIEANADVASRLSNLVGDFVDYGNTKQKMENLSSKLELPTVSSQR